MVETLLAGALGILGSAIGYGVAAWENLKTTEKQIRSEDRRRRGEYYLERKVNALMELHSTLKATRRLYKFKADRVGHERLPEEEYEEVLQQFRDYERTVNDASIFLDDEQQRALTDVIGILLDANRNLSNAVNNPPESVERYSFGFTEFNDRFDKAEDVLQNEIKGPIDAFEDSTPH